jgi:hypothetical protein
MLAGSFSLGHIPYADSITNIDHSHILFTASPVFTPCFSLHAVVDGQVIFLIERSLRKDYIVLHLYLQFVI